MKIYLAARTRHTEKLLKLAEFLKEQGHEITSTWIYITDKLKPFHENLFRVREIAHENLQMMVESDCLIMLNDPGGTDLFSEFGICLATKKIKKPNMKIYVVGKFDEATILQHGSLVEHFETLEQVLQKEGIVMNEEIKNLKFE
jgi:sucrose-6-phosphate hydrolase SacC (GH32 family)